MAGCTADWARTPVRVALFDFDGTISTLRYGWEEIMKPLMLEMISGKTEGFEEALVREVEAYIDRSTGIQTIYQMKWLAEQAVGRGLNPNAWTDPWAYKAEYNRRLMQTVEKRIARLQEGAVSKEQFLIAGSRAFLMHLKALGVRLMIASGTDHPDVVREAKALQLDGLFETIAGAPVAEESCSKEKVLKTLIEDSGMKGEEIAVIGDGKVEIALGNAFGARTLGMATDEARRVGVNPVKRERLLHAQADLLVGDFLDMEPLLSFLGWSARP